MVTQHKKAAAAASRKRIWKRRGRKATRKKISTTIGPENYAFVQNLITSRKAQNLAEALDLVLEEARRLDNRARLEKSYEEHYSGAYPEAVAEENEIAAAFSRSAHEIRIDE